MNLDTFELLQFAFVQRMLIAGFLASIVCGLIGTYVVVKRIVFISGGIAHTTFGGIVADIYSDIIQLIILWFGAILIILLLLVNIDTQDLALLFTRSERLQVFNFRATGR